MNFITLFRTKDKMQQSQGVLLGILGGGVPSVSSNPDPTSDQKM